MMPTKNGSIHLFRLAGINVFLHWSWFIAAVYFINAGSYPNIFWNILECIGLFLIVLLHEFGHSLACRQTGGRADQIVLWPLGGVAYVDPPQRPGATLWSIAAGPLVNVALAPIFGGLFILGKVLHWPETMPNAFQLIDMLLHIDVYLLLFNILPIFPLDGGQILRSLLWFPLGRARSLMVTTILGFFGVAVILAFSVLLLVKYGSFWMCIMSAFLAMNCWQGFQHARVLRKVSKLPRHSNFICPECKAAPPVGAFWQCGGCQKPFDLFASTGSCPHCLTLFNIGRCPDCGRVHPLNDWVSLEKAAKM